MEMGIFDGFKKHYETGDQVGDAMLVTHYYRNNYQQVKKGLLETADTLGFNVAYINDERKEFVFKRKDCEIIVTVINITPIETTVDFTINTYGVLSFGKGRKVIDELYKDLDKRLMLKGRGV